MMNLSDMLALRLEGTPLVRLSVEGETVWESTAEYRELEYICMDGSTYVDTGIAPADCDGGLLSYAARVDVDCSIDDGEMHLCGATDGTNYSCVITFNPYSNPTYNTVCVKAGVTGAARYIPAFPDQAATVSVSLKSGGLHWKTDMEGYTSERSSSFTGSTALEQTVYVGRCNGEESVGLVGKLYEFIIATYTYPVTVQLEESTYILHMIPCMRMNDGALGMYDTVANVFHPVKGTGEATAGPAV